MTDELRNKCKHYSDLSAAAEIVINELRAENKVLREALGNCEQQLNKSLTNSA